MIDSSTPAGSERRSGLDLAELYQAHRDEVFGLLYSRCGDRELAWDLVQDTFERVARWARCNRWQDRGRAPVALLFTVARNLLFDHRKSSRRRETPAELGTDAALLWTPVGEPVEEVVVDRLQQAAFRRALADDARLLTDRQRRVLHLAAEGLTDRAISERLGMQPMSVKGCRHRAIRRLRGSSRMRALAAANGWPPPADS